jgi:hypothetical protein
MMDPFSVFGVELLLLVDALYMLWRFDRDERARMRPVAVRVRR